MIEQLAADQLAAGRGPAPLAAMGFLTRRPPLPQQPARHHRRPHRRRQPRPAGADRRLRPLPRSQVRSRSRRRTTTRCTASSPARTEPRELPLIGAAGRSPHATSTQKELDSARRSRREFFQAQARRLDEVRLGASRRTCWRPRAPVSGVGRAHGAEPPRCDAMAEADLHPVDPPSLAGLPGADAQEAGRCSPSGTPFAGLPEGEFAAGSRRR